MTTPALPRAADVIVGGGFAAAAWAAMNHVVVPLSNASAPPFIVSWLIDGVLAHVLLVGLLLAYVARRSARRPG